MNNVNASVAITQEEADLLISDLKRISRSPDWDFGNSELTALRYELFAKRIQAATYGIESAVVWAREWLTDLQQKSAEQEILRLEQELLQKQHAEELQKQKKAGLCSNPRYQAWLNTYEEPEHAPNHEYMIWIPERLNEFGRIYKGQVLDGRGRPTQEYTEAATRYMMDWAEQHLSQRLVAQRLAERTESKAKASKNIPLMPGDQFRTMSGRVTTALPNINGKRESLNMSRLNTWLKEEALAEAGFRNDRFNQVQWSALDIKNFTPADYDAVNLYLFNDTSGRIGEYKVTALNETNSERCVAVLNELIGQYNWRSVANDPNFSVSSADETQYIYVTDDHVTFEDTRAHTEVRIYPNGDIGSIVEDKIENLVYAKELQELSIFNSSPKTMAFWLNRFSVKINSAVTKELNGKTSVKQAREKAKDQVIEWSLLAIANKLAIDQFKLKVGSSVAVTSSSGERIYTVDSINEDFTLSMVHGKETAITQYLRDYNPSELAGRKSRLNNQNEQEMDLFGDGIENHEEEIHADETLTSENPKNEFNLIRTRFQLKNNYPLGETEILMNCVRPLVGNRVYENGEYVSGRYYAIIDLNDPNAERWILENKKLDACMIIQTDLFTLMEMAMIGNKYEAEYRSLDPKKRFKYLQPSIEDLNDKPYMEMRELEQAARTSNRLSKIETEIVSLSHIREAEISFNEVREKINILSDEFKDVLRFGRMNLALYSNVALTKYELRINDGENHILLQDIPAEQLIENIKKHSEFKHVMGNIYQLTEPQVSSLIDMLDEAPYPKHHHLHMGIPQFNNKILITDDIENSTTFKIMDEEGNVFHVEDKIQIQRLGEVLNSSRQQKLSYSLPFNNDCIFLQAREHQNLSNENSQNMMM